MRWRRHLGCLRLSGIRREPTRSRLGHRGSSARIPHLQRNQRNLRGAKIVHEDMKILKGGAIGVEMDDDIEIGAERGDTEIVMGRDGTEIVMGRDSTGTEAGKDGTEIMMGRDGIEIEAGIGGIATKGGNIVARSGLEMTNEKGGTEAGAETDAIGHHHQRETGV